MLATSSLKTKLRSGNAVGSPSSASRMGATRSDYSGLPGTVLLAAERHVAGSSGHRRAPALSPLNRDREALAMPKMVRPWEYGADIELSDTACERSEGFD